MELIGGDLQPVPQVHLDCHCVNSAEKIMHTFSPRVSSAGVLPPMGDDDDDDDAGVPVSTWLLCGLHA